MVVSQAVAIGSTRTIKDPIHDFITFPSYIWTFIDTRQFQRLRAIKQLGVSYYVWAGASHNRFEHCIGVAHLAGLLVDRLRRIQPELGITERDVRCVQLAGLCHDLGHGPWSHVWDGLFIPSVLPGRQWTHEDASEMMFDDLVEKNDIQIDQDDINFIKDLIKGVPSHSAHKNPPEKIFLFDIVANKRNGIDVDKFDYIARDVRAIGDHNNFSARRLIDSARVIDDQICFHIKDANSVYELCQLRFSNHKRIYSHKTARAIEYMLVDALRAAEPFMHIAEQIMDPGKYVYLTDNIMERIEMSEDPQLVPSRRILDRIRIRDIYKCVDWGTHPYDFRELLQREITSDRVVKSAQEWFRRTSRNEASEESQLRNVDISGLSPEHVVVDLSTLHHGMKERNPIDSVRFYGKHDLHKSFKAESGELSTLMPACFAEIQLRIYTKDSRYYGIIQAGFRELLSEVLESSFCANFNTSPSPTTTDAPTTPKASCSPPNSRPGSRNVSFSGLGKTPSFTTQNKFTKVGADYVPQSPLVHRQSLHSRSNSGSDLQAKTSFVSVSSVATEIEGESGSANSDSCRVRAATPEKATNSEDQAEFSTPKKRPSKTLEAAIDITPRNSRTRGKRNIPTETKEDIPVKKRRS